MAHMMQTELTAKRFESPDETREFTDGKGRAELVRIGDHTASRSTFKPGWQWSINIKPLVHTESCEVFHLGMVQEGRMRITMDNGDALEVGPGDVFEIPPGHDAEVIGDADCVLIDFGDMSEYAQPRTD
ncbi:MAG: cupin domain-containing protein [Solirubrobacterales bacterium]